MGISEPTTAKEWQELRIKLRTATADDFPGVDPAKFGEFKKLLLSKSNLVGLPMPLVIGFLAITEYALRLINWGAIGWLMGLVVGAVGGGLLNARYVKATESKALILGREIGFFSDGPGGEAGPAEDRRPVPDNASKPRISLAMAIPVALLAGAVLAIIGMRLLGIASFEAATGDEDGNSAPAPYKSDSPGGKVVFNSGEKGGAPYKIFTLDVASGAEIQITDGTQRDLRPSWSPDGKRIAFTRATGDYKEADIYVMNADGSNIAQVTNTTNEAEYGSAWSPNGSRLLTTVGDFDDADGKTIEIEVVGINIRALDAGDYPGRKKEQLTKNQVPDYDPDWSPDGNEIAFVSGDFEHADIMVMNADGSNKRKITDVRGPYASPKWSPDGRRIVYTSGNWKSPKLFLMNADGSGRHELTAGKNAAWSSDGEWIVFEDGLLYVIRPDGRNRKRLTTSGIEARFPAWTAAP